MTEEAAAIDAAVLQAVRENQVTPDIGGTLGTREAGDYIAQTDAAGREFDRQDVAHRHRRPQTS